MSSQLLLSELTALSAEAKRKCPDVRAASDAALAALRTRPNDIIGASSQNTETGPAGGTILLQPIVLACEGKAAPSKVVSIAVSLLQRVASLRALPDDAVASVIDLLQHVVSTRTDVDIHLKVLQAIATMLSTYPAIHDSVLSNTLRICFQLQQSSRVGVINSTAAATLRQAVMTIFDKVRDEDAVLDGIKSGGEDAAAAAPLASMTVQLHGSGPVTLFPSAADAYRIMRDLNGLANNERAAFLELEGLSRTFTLELIESVLTNHARLFRSGTHPELLLCLREATCPLLIRAFNERSTFPVTLRLMRILFVLLRQFSTELVVEVEILISILLRVVSSDTERRTSSAGTRTSVDAFPIWHKILAMEATKSLCSDSVLIRNLWKWFDGKDSKAQVYTSLVKTLSKVVWDNAALLGQAAPEHQLEQPVRSIGQPHQRETSEPRRSSSTYASNLYEAAAGAAHAAVGGLAPLSEETATGLSLSHMPSVQLIDQLDKTEAPTMHPTYVVLLALQSCILLVHSLASYLLPFYASYVEKQYADQSAPPPLDVVKLGEGDRHEVLPLQDMLKATCSLLSGILGQTMSSQCDESIFAETLRALRHLTITAGVLGQDEIRDDLCSLLASFAAPRAILARCLSARRAAGEEATTTLSKRNRACVKTLTEIAIYLAGCLETHWRVVLEAICDAEFILRRASEDNGRQDDVTIGDSSIADLSMVEAPFSATAGSSSATTSDIIFSECRHQHLMQRIDLVFRRCTALDASSLLSFLVSLCELNAEQIGLRGAVSSVERNVPLTRLGDVVHDNHRRLATDRNLERGWTLIVQHYLAVLKHSAVRASIRLQAAESFDSFLQSALECASETKAKGIEERVVVALAEQCTLDGQRRSATDIDVRRVGYETLLTVLQVHGHAFDIRWQPIFDSLEAAASSAPSEEDKSGVPLIKAAFSALQVVCSELLSKLSIDELRRCTSTLSLFAQQQEDVNVALTANGAIWTITAEVVARAERGDAREISHLWTHILSNLKGLTSDPRMQIRHGAISLFFNVLEQYGPSLPTSMWTQSVMPQIMWPLLQALQSRLHAPSHGATGEAAATDSASDNGDAAQWVESMVLALTGLGRVVRQAALDKLARATQVWDDLYAFLGATYIEGPDGVSQAAIKAYHHIMDVVEVQEGSIDKDLQAICWKAWSIWCNTGAELANATVVLSQSSLVAYVDALAPVQGALRRGLTARQLDEMLSAFKAAITYKPKAERIHDVERLSPLQKAVMTRISAVHMTDSSSAQVLQAYAELSLLAFDKSSHYSFIALNQVATEAMNQIYQQWAASSQLYSSGALTTAFDALSIPLQLRYTCPAAPGKPADAWKASLVALCHMASTWCAQGEGLRLKDSIAGNVWTSMTSTLASALTADCTAVDDMTPDMQEEEDMYDLLLLSTIETKIWHTLGNAVVPPACIVHLAEAITRTSYLTLSLHDNLDDRPDTPPDSADEDGDDAIDASFGDMRAPRERVAYWCLDLLFLMCSMQPNLRPASVTSVTSVASVASVKSAQRVAELFLPRLFVRIRRTLAAYIAKRKTAGATPLSRIANEEVNYILSKLSGLQLWPGSFDAAMQRKADRSSAVDRVQAGAAAHARHDQDARGKKGAEPLLRRLYPLLCDFLHQVVPRGSPAVFACGSSQIYTRPVDLPKGFTLGQVGRNVTDYDGDHSGDERSEAEAAAKCRVRSHEEDGIRGDGSDACDSDGELSSHCRPRKQDARRLGRNLLARLGAS